MGQPESYGDSFHFKANAISDAPSVGNFVQSLIEELRAEFDVVALDLGRSWGLGSLAALPLCNKILLVMDDDPIGKSQTLKTCERLVHQAKTESQLGIKNWNVVLNAHTGSLLSPKELQQSLEKIDIFPPNRGFFVVSYTGSGRYWGAPGTTLFEIGGRKTKNELTVMASQLAPFIRPSQTSIKDRIKEFFH
jgi:hypothetical protein